MRLFRPASRSFTLGPSWPILFVAALVLAPGTAIGEYRLQPGDTLEVLITGVQDFRQPAPIGAEGDIGLPLAGQIKVGDLSVSAATSTIDAQLSNKLYRQYTNDGREISHLILGDEVVVAVSEYVPIYVNGDVAKPGAYPFRPGITVRQAVTVAGGYDLMRVQNADPFLQSADLQSDYQSLWVEFASEQARSWRLRIELGEPGVESTGNKAPIPGSDAGGLFMKAETEQLNARKADRDSSKALLQEAIRKATLQQSILGEKKAKDEEGSQADLADFNTVRDLFRKGLAPVTRLSESRRAALMSSEQLLQTVVEMSNVERQRDEYTRQLEKIDSQSRIDDLQELQQVNLRLAQISARLKSTGEKLTHIGLLRSRLEQGAGGRIEITVHQKGKNGAQSLTADEDLELAPGDVVDVALRSEGAAGVITSMNVR